MQDAFEVYEMRHQSFGLSIRRERIDRRRRFRSIPGALLARVGPQPSCFRLCAALIYLAGGDVGCYRKTILLAGDETPVSGRSSNGGFWPKKVKNAFNGG